MTKMINREDVLMQLDRLVNNQIDYKIAKGITAAIHIIEKMPIEVEGWKVGRWIVSEVRCPDCLEYFDTDVYNEGELDECPNCGAVIRQKEGGTAE